MKKTLRFFAMLIMAAAFTFSFSSCEKDDTDTPNNQTQQGINAEIFANTSWLGTIESTINYMGVDMLIGIDASLDFFDDTKGEMFINFLVNIPQMPDMNMEEEETFSFDYVVKDNIITITYEQEDEDTHEIQTVSENLVYNPENETISYAIDDPEMSEMMGVDSIVFTKAPSGK